MPSTFIARRDMAYLLAAARLALTQQLAAAAAGQQAAGMLSGLLSGCSAGVAAGFGDAVLAALPQLLNDGLLQEELMARWWGRCRGLAAAAAEVRNSQVCALSDVYLCARGMRARTCRLLWGWGGG
jgi:hypothetical protein